MATFLFHVSYTSESWAMQVREHPDVIKRIQPSIESLGGSITGCYYALGAADLILLAEFPSVEEAAAFSLAATAGGSVKSIATTALLSVEQGMAAMQRAHEAGSHYVPPVPSSRTPVA
jgi:uncharacterized protein with GYD domain